MNTAKIYYDGEGNERSIHWMVKNEPQWAANRIQVGEAAIEKLSQLQNTSSNCEYKSPSAQLKKLAENQKSLTPEMVSIINENFWELF